MPRVLVTGGAGFIGGHLAKLLLDDGYEVDVVDSLRTGSHENVPERAGFYELDLGREHAVAGLPDKRYAAIMHLAGQSSGERSFDDPLYDLDANARSTLLLSSWAAEHEVPVFLYASSMGVYGQVETHPVSEGVDLRPISYYGASKYAAEQILSLASTRKPGLRTCSFRMFSVYGPGQNLADLKQGMVSIYLAYLLHGEPVVVKGSLDRVRDFIHVDDVVTAWRMALEQPVSGVFNLGSGTGTRVGEMLTELIAACGHGPDYPIVPGENTPGDQFAVSANIERLRTELAWEPRISLSDGLKALVASVSGASR